MMWASGSCIIGSTYHNNVLNEADFTPLANGNRQQSGLQVSGDAAGAPPQVPSGD